MIHRKLIARGFHGTTLVAARSILNGRFEQEVRDWHWLGQGVYFWQDAEMRAWEWAVHVANEKITRAEEEGIPLPIGDDVKPAVISADIHLNNCFDLLDIDDWPYLETAWDKIHLDHEIKNELHLLEQIGPLEALNRTSGKRYGNNRGDYRAMNMALQLRKEAKGIPVATARGAFMEGTALFNDSWLFDRSHIQIAVVNPMAIPDVVRNVKIVSSMRLKREYDKLLTLHKTNWARRMKSTVGAK